MAISKIDLHFLKIAKQQSMSDPAAITSKSKSHASHRQKRGAVIARANKMISAGISMHLGGNLYKPEIHEERYIATINAELVAIGQAISSGATLTNVTIYISDCPNWITFKMLITMGIKRIVHYGPCFNDRITHYAKELGIELISVGG